MPNPFPQLGPCITKWAFSILVWVHHTWGNMVRTFDCSCTFFVTTPYKAVLRKVVTQRDFQNCVGFKRQENGSYHINFPPFSVIVNERRHHGEIFKICLGWDHFVSCWCWQPLIVPNMDSSTITYPPSCALSEYFKAVVDTTPCIRGVATFLGVKHFIMREVLDFINPSH